MKRSITKSILTCLCAILIATATSAQSLEINVESPGTLKELLGDKALTATEIKVTGTIDETDYTTLWECTFYGRCESIDLTGITGGGSPEYTVVPQNAFYRPKVQGDPAQEGFKTVKLKQISLPEITTYIETAAFEGVPIKEILLPNRLSVIMPYAFAYSALEKVDFSRSPVLERILDYAFARTHITEASFPEPCGFFGEGCFEYCRELKSMTFRNGLYIYPNVAAHCGLEKVSLSNMTKLAEGMFADNPDLRSIVIPESVRWIEGNVFEGCGLETVTIEGTSLLYSDSFANLPTLARIYSKSPVPPETLVSDEQQYPFSGTTPRTATVYVPTGSAETYRNTEGWNYFSNFVEISEFPDTGVGQVTDTDKERPTVKSTGGEIRIEASGTYNVFSIDGTNLANGNVDGTARIPCEPGLYIVNVNGASFKIMVR